MSPASRPRHQHGAATVEYCIVAALAAVVVLVVIVLAFLRKSGAPA